MKPTGIAADDATKRCQRKGEPNDGEMCGYDSPGGHRNGVLSQRQLPCVSNHHDQAQQDQRDRERCRHRSYPDVGQASGEYEREAQRVQMRREDPGDPTAGHSRELLAYYVPRWQSRASKDQHGHDGNERAPHQEHPGW